MVTNKHHVVPQSRAREFNINVNDRSNIARVDPRLHAIYHQLFANMTPREIIYFLAKTFWRGHVPDLGDDHGRKV